MTFIVILHSLAFKATVSSQFWCLESPSLLNLGVQSHHLFSVWCSKPPSLLSYSIQSCHIFSVTTFIVVLHSLAFRATVSSQFRHSEPPFLFSLAFKATIPSQLWSSEPPFFYILAFRAAISSQLRRSELSFLVWGSDSCLQFQAFKATHLFQFQAFEATISPQFGVQSHHHMSSVWRLESCLQF